MKTLIALLLAVAAFPAKAGAQGGFYLVPSVSVAEVSDTYQFSSAPAATDSRTTALQWNDAIHLANQAAGHTLSAAEIQALLARFGGNVGMTVDSASLAPVLQYLQSQGGTPSTSSTNDSDIVLRMSPDVRAGYRSPLLQLTAEYTNDFERSRTHPDLNNFFVRQKAEANLLYTIGRHWTYVTAASYVATHTPQEFNDATGLIVQRAPASFFAVGPRLGYQFDSRNHASVGLQYERMDAYTSITTDAFAAAITAQQQASALREVAGSIVTKGISLGFERRLSTRDELLTQYRERQYEFGGESLFAGTVRSRTMLLGVTHELSSQNRLTIMAGPRLSDGAVGPEVSVQLRRRLQSGELAFGLERTERVALGQAGMIDVDSLNGSLKMRPRPRLELRVKPGVNRDRARLTPLQVTVYTVGVAATHAVNRRLSIEGAYQGAWERGDIPPLGPLAFAHTVFTIRAIASVDGWPKTLVPRAPETAK